jgi:F420-0:gamma-glutamyl ligase
MTSEKSSISRDDILVLIEAERKSALYMGKITTCLETVVSQQEKIMARLSNGMPEEICQYVTNSIKEHNANSEKIGQEIKNLVAEMAKDVFWLKLFWGLIGLAIVIVGVLTKK